MARSVLVPMIVFGQVTVRSGLLESDHGEVLLASDAWLTASATMCATWSSASEYATSRPRRSVRTTRAPRRTRRCCDTSDLRGTERVDQFMDAAWTRRQLFDDCQTVLAGQRAQQLGRRRQAGGAGEGTHDVQTLACLHVFSDSDARVQWLGSAAKR